MTCFLVMLAALHPHHVKVLGLAILTGVFYFSSFESYLCIPDTSLLLLVVCRYSRNPLRSLSSCWLLEDLFFCVLHLNQWGIFSVHCRSYET